MIASNDPITNGRPTWWRSLRDATASLQCKATACVVLCTLVVTAGASGYLLKSGLTLARDARDQQIVEMAALLARTAADILASGDGEALTALADAAANGTPLMYVAFFDAEGRQLISSEHRSVRILAQLDADPGPARSNVGRPVFHPRTSDRPALLDVTYPIGPAMATLAAPSGASSGLLGYVRAGMRADGWERAMLYTVDTLTGLGILATVVAIPIGFFLVRRIVAPLHGLSRVMKQFSEGHLGARISVRRRDEIGQLGRAFNTMADQHQSTHNRIVRLNAELEERVARRTEQLKELASREPLTGLYNRRSFDEMLKRHLAGAQRYDGDLTCLMIDLDDFKAINDAFGHHAGDEVLILVADTISSQLRGSDFAARLGGDEFVVVLPQTEADRARVLAERIVEKLAIEMGVKLPRLQLSLSIGIASARELNTADATTLVHTADSALYEAKAAGKNCVVTASAASKPAAL